jgi:hypothetical protein
MEVSREWNEGQLALFSALAKICDRVAREDAEGTLAQAIQCRVPTTVLI